MKVLTKQEVLRRIENYCKTYVTYSAAAKAIGCTPAQLSEARRDKEPPCPAILDAIGVSRQPLYATQVEDKYLDGCMNLDL